MLKAILSRGISADSGCLLGNVGETEENERDCALVIPREGVAKGVKE